MPYKHHPVDYCSGTWPDGPFRTPPGAPDEPGALVAVTAAAAVASAITRRRTARRWSRATLADAATVGQHTVGRIEAGRAWPDLATVARLGKALNLTPALTSAGAPSRPPDPAARPPGPAVAGLPVGLPLEVDLAGLAEPTAAHVIEAILHNSPRLRGQVEDLRRRRATRPS